MGITISSSLSLKKLKKLINQNNSVITSMSSLGDSVKQDMPPTVIPMAQVSSGDYMSSRVHVPSGKTMYVWVAGLQDGNNNVPSGCSAQIVNETSGQSWSYGDKRIEGTPLAEIQGAADVRLASNNGSSSLQNITSFFTFTVE